MVVAVLSPQDCLRDGLSHNRRRLISPPRSKARRGSGSPNSKPDQTRSGRRKQWSPSGSPPPPQSSPNNDVKSYRSKTPDLPGQIRILKRGEEFTPTKQLTATAFTTPVKDRKTNREGSFNRANSDPVALSTQSKGRDPIPIPFIGGFYAGSAFSTSPPPSSLPVPGFCRSIGSGAGSLMRSTAEDVVAVDLRRMLRIE